MKFEDESVVNDEHNAYKHEEYECPICMETHQTKDKTWWLVTMIDGVVKDVCDDCFRECLDSGAIMRDNNPRAKSDYKMS